MSAIELSLFPELAPDRPLGAGAELGQAGDEPPPVEVSTDARRTIRHRELLAQGIHPATRAPLLDAEWGFRCGDCAHALRAWPGRRTFWKCELHRLGPSSSAASDIRASWPACTLLEIRGVP